ncbi:fucolectin-like [Mytilus californianus]|uniref:fucolectin-like n=1 Tax=Mytilus californianus TaxID=6549 RepID=UPI0022478EAE|nr:fucolectin-like [Mytilus californianus]
MKMLFFLLLSLLHVGLPSRITFTGTASISCCSELEKKVKQLDRRAEINALKAKIETLEERIANIEYKKTGSCGKKNLALNKKCGQSSYKDGSACGLAVDGNFNTVIHTTYFWKNNAWHGETNPYWWVDLESSCVVKLIKIYNRKDCCGKRFRNVEVTIGNSLAYMKFCGYYKGTATKGEIISMSCREPMVARYVKVMMKDQNTEDTILNFAEVQVFS